MLFCLFPGQYDNAAYNDTEEEKGSKRNKPPPYSEYPPSPIKVVPVDYVETSSPEEDEDDPVKMKKKLAERYSRA